ncbi:DUF6173 family protein [Labrys sedimenti]|uniref:DUF6173 family protein n=1 Tax=Labrys sedimenti TaxID=3106036 RepID=UPI002ACAF825|nr:DUF6173 family protein [Labrys sp. ZIDIC5]MDZ5453900.1 DUF6173 family protein [Labrys sp. ZIDIC5]
MDDRFKHLTGAALPDPGRLPQFSPVALPPPANSARWMHERIIKSIIEFEKKLDDKTEVGGRLVNFGARETIAIDDVGFWGPDLVIFYGKNADGHPVELLQHVTQINVLLVAIPAETETPRRIGFILEKRLKPTKEEET